jgi:N-acetylglutamate synthase-like GNAT family acetyltransferase
VSVQFRSFLAGDEVEGGHILMAVDGEFAVGCCALLAMEPGCFELSKMAVHESRRGEGLGRSLLEYAVAQARDLGAHRLYLETSTKLQNAVHLYQSVGFRHLPPERIRQSAYTRSNVYMEMWL